MRHVPTTSRLHVVGIASAASAAFISLLALMLVNAPPGHESIAEATGPSAPNQMALDADVVTPGTQASLSVSGTAPFSIGVDVTKTAGPYSGYQWEIEFATIGLAYASSAENSAATGFALCSSNHDATPGTIDSTNDTDIAGGCAGTTSSTYTGLVTTISLQCKADGWYTISLIDASQDGAFGSTLLDSGGGTLDTGTSGLSMISCSGTGATGTTPTPTPASATATPTPAATATPTLALPGPANDLDGDGCPNLREQGPDHRTGGQRDPLDPWDFFDVPVPALSAAHPWGQRDKVITDADVQAVLFYVGAAVGHGPNPNGVTYTDDVNHDGIPDGLAYDRSPSQDVSKPWQSGPPRGAINLQDVLVVLAQKGDDCR